MVFYMALALDEAKSAAAREEVPIGAVVVERHSGQVLAQASNRTIEYSDPSAHAEMLAIREACRKVGAQRIPQADLYVTLEPCPMCAAAISFARIGRLYIAATDPKSGGVLHGPCLYEHAALHHKPEVHKIDGDPANQAADLLRGFFRERR